MPSRMLLIEALESVVQTLSLDRYGEPPVQQLVLTISAVLAAHDEPWRGALRSYPHAYAEALALSAVEALIEFPDELRAWAAAGEGQDHRVVQRAVENIKQAVREAATLRADDTVVRLR